MLHAHSMWRRGVPLNRRQNRAINLLSLLTQSYEEVTINSQGLARKNEKKIAAFKQGAALGLVH